MLSCHSDMGLDGNVGCICADFPHTRMRFRSAATKSFGKVHASLALNSYLSCMVPWCFPLAENGPSDLGPRTLTNEILPISGDFLLPASPFIAPVTLCLMHSCAISDFSHRFRRSASRLGLLGQSTNHCSLWRMRGHLVPG